MITGDHAATAEAIAGDRVADPRARSSRARARRDERRGARRAGHPIGLHARVPAGQVRIMRRARQGCRRDDGRRRERRARAPARRHGCARPRGIDREGRLRHRAHRRRLRDDRRGRARGAAHESNASAIAFCSSNAGGARSSSDRARLARTAATHILRQPRDRRCARVSWGRPARQGRHATGRAGARGSSRGARAASLPGATFVVTLAAFQLGGAACAALELAQTMAFATLALSQVALLASVTRRCSWTRRAQPHAHARGGVLDRGRGRVHRGRRSRRCSASRRSTRSGSRCSPRGRPLGVVEAVKALGWNEPAQNPTSADLA